jgi:hypothetical protein
MPDGSRPRVLVLSFTDLARDPRVDRQIRFLAERYTVVAAGTGEPGVPEVAYVPLAPRPKRLRGRLVGAVRLGLRRYETYYWATAAVSDCRARLADLRFDLVLANDIETLPVALAIAGPAPVLFDAHEYAPLEFEDQLTFRLLHRPYRFHLCRTYMPRARACTTVCDRIAEEYERLVGCRPGVVWNAPAFEPLVPSPVEPDRIRLVHHGGTQRSRRLEGMIRMMHHLDERFSLDLVLQASDPDSLVRLRREARGDRRIRFVDPVPMRALPSFLNRYDLGVFLLPPVNFNYRYALPNKLFEFVQARIGVAIGPSPEMARLVERHGLGVVAEDFAPRALAARLAALGAGRVRELKLAADRAAQELSADRAREQILGLAGSALDGGS